MLVAVVAAVLGLTYLHVGIDGLSTPWQAEHRGRTFPSLVPDLPQNTACAPCGQIGHMALCFRGAWSAFWTQNFH